MKITNSNFRVVLSVYLFLLSSLSGLAQSNSGVISFDQVKMEIDRYTHKEANFWGQRNYLIEQPDGNFLLARSASSLGSAGKVNFFLFSQDGKLISSNLDFRKQEKTKKHHSIEITEFNGKYYLITTVIPREIRATSRDYYLWDLSDYANMKLAAHVKDVMIVYAREEYGKTAVSPNGKYLMLATGCASSVVLFDQNLDVVYKKQLVETPKEELPTGGILDAITVDDDGYMTVSGFIYAHAVRMDVGKKGKEGSWVFMGIDTQSDDIFSMSMAEIVKSSKYKSNTTAALPLGKGKVVYCTKVLPSSRDEDKGQVVMIEFDVAKQDVTNSRLIPSASALKAKGGMTVTDMKIFGDNFLLYGTVNAMGSQNAILVVNRDGDVINSKIITPRVQTDAVHYAWNGYADEENYYIVYSSDKKDIKYFDGGEMPQLAPRMIAFTDSDEPLLLKYNVATNELTYTQCPEEPKSKSMNREVFISDKGHVVVADYDGSKKIKLSMMRIK